MADYSTPLGKFEQQRRQAKQRGIEWLFTFEDWFAFWTESGKWELRGKGTGKFVMARRGDIGPYSRDNCFICTFEQNISDGHIPAGVRPPKLRKEARGWTYRTGPRFSKKPYQVMYGQRYIGLFSTQAEAEAAHKAAFIEARRSHEGHFSAGESLNATQLIGETLCTN